MDKNRNKYIARIEYIKNKPLLFNIVKACYIVVPYIIAAVYIIVIGWNLYEMLTYNIYCKLIATTSGPLCAFIIGSVLRKLINAQRPYERYEYNSLIKKNKAGESFPSRHAVSAFAIASACYVTSYIVGLIVLILATVVALIRYLTGVHYAKDVICGAVLGITVSMICSYVALLYIR